VIKSIRHKALRHYWTRGDQRGLNPNWLTKIRRVLCVLDAASSAEDLDLPGYYFHRLSGKWANRFSVRVSRNYRLTFGWEKDGPIDLDLEDYH